MTHYSCGKKESSKGFKMKMMIPKAELGMLEKLLAIETPIKSIALNMMVKMKSVILTLLLIF